MLVSMQLITACPRDLHVSVDVNDPSRPVFCVSDGRNCSGKGIRLSEFFVAAVDESGSYVRDGELIEPMWIIEPERDIPLKEFVYGEVPAGWRELSASRPLVVGNWYTVGSHYFLLQKENGKYRAEVLSLIEFLRQAH